MQQDPAKTLLLSCSKDAENFPSSPEALHFTRAIKSLCDQPEYADQVDTWVDPKFMDNYKKLYSKDGWLDEAYVSYFGLPDDAQKSVNIVTQMTWLMKSVESSSTRPHVAFNFGSVDTTWQPADFPNTVLMHAKPMNKNAVFNFNKFRAMILSKVKTGIMLDADEFVAPSADLLFPRIKEEINADYPYPILPVHWFSRDNDEKFPDHPYKVYDFECKGCPERSARWGHAHPTFTYHALPFLATWLRKTLDHEMVGNESLQYKEDEDVLNMALWDAKVTKQWCKFDIPFEGEFFKYIRGEGYENGKGGNGLIKYEDPKWYPEGIPLVFYTAHHAVNFDETSQILRELEHGPEQHMPWESFMQVSEASPKVTAGLVTNEALLSMLQGNTIPAGSSSLMEVAQTAYKVVEYNPRDGVKTFKLPPPIFYQGKYYNDGRELKAAHPDLRCII